MVICLPGPLKSKRPGQNFESVSDQCHTEWLSSTLVTLEGVCGNEGEALALECGLCDLSKSTKSSESWSPYVHHS